MQPDEAYKIARELDALGLPHHPHIGFGEPPHIEGVADVIYEVQCVAEDYAIYITSPEGWGALKPFLQPAPERDNHA